MSKLSILDLGFLIAESEASPKHVAGLLIFKRPAKSRPNFAKKLYEEFLDATKVTPPFNRIIQFSLTSMPYWLDAKEVDLNQHVFFHTLDKSSNSRADLYRFV